MGFFSQSPSNHLQGQGCPECGNSNKDGGWSYSSWKKNALKSKSFDSFKLYVIKCYNKKEEFIKIGRTYNTITKRFRRLPYQYEVLQIIEDKDPKIICELEVELQNKFSEFSYIPKNRIWWST